MIKHLDLFSGIGGFALAAHWAGFETVAFCEIETYCRQVLKKHWPSTPIHEDIRGLDGTEYAAIDLITGGYPCQPFSLAGARKGEDDYRHLWPQMLRIITQARPTWVVAENVTGHITMGLDQVLTNLESEGYAARPVVIPACAIDAPHRRDRVWIVAHSKSSHDGFSYASEIKRQEQKPGNSGSQNTVADTDSGNARRECTGQETGGNIDKHVAPPRPMANANDTRPQEREVFAGGQSQARPTQPGQAFKRNDRWPTEPGVGRVAHGVPCRVDRIKGLGNAIVPQVAFQILKPIAKLLSDP